MDKTIYEKWIQLHNNSNSRKDLPDILFSSWKKSYELGIDAVNSLPLICTDEEFNIKKEKSKSLYYYANDSIATTSEHFAESNFGIALFDKTGCLIKLYGNEEFNSWSKENKLEIKTVWDENVIGTNAISLGLRLKKSVSVIGEEHFSKFAINFAVYFSPIILEKDTNNINECGGIAIITAAENKNPNFLFTADSISRGIAMHYFWFESLHLLVNSVDGYVIIDQSNNRNKLIFISTQIYNFFSMPLKDMYYRNLEEIIDPYPQNKDFWDIIDNKTPVQDMDMKLFVQEKQVKVNFSLRPFYEKNYHFQGASIIFNSRERINNLISRHTGNNATFTFSQIIGQNEKFLNTLNQAKAASQSSINILLLGESGVGKDIIAQSIHNASERQDKPFIAVNCAAFPKDLISSELFGYEDGAFTGSKKGGNIGKFELANQGTIFLDEIGDMPLDLQAILLRVIEQKTFMKIGSNISTNIDVRIIAATNKNLKEKVRKGEFREDLYFRLGIIRILIPPLRNRKDDILLLAEQFMKKICNRLNKPLVILSPQVKDFFLDYHWPGNVRELQNLLEGVIQVYDGTVINYDLIANYLMDDQFFDNNIVPPLSKEGDLNKSLPCKDAYFDFKQINTKKPYVANPKEYLVYALELNKNNKSKTAKYLGISRNTLYIRLKEYDLL